MAFARLGAGAGSTIGTTTASWTSFNITTSDANTVSIVLVNISPSSNANATCSVKYDTAGANITMKQLGIVNTGATSTTRAAVAIYYLFNPPTGAKNITVTPAGATIAGTRGVDVAFSGVSSIGAAQNVATMAHTVNSVSGGYALRVLSNGVTTGTLSNTTELAGGSSITGLGDFIAVQSAAGAATVAFTASGTATTPLSMGCTVNPVGQINFVQSASSAMAVASSRAAVLTGPCFLGDVIVAAWKINESSGTVSSVTDTVGNIYSLANPGTFQTGAGTVWMYYAPVTHAADAGANTVTATMSISETNMELMVGEWDNVDLNSPLDKHVVPVGTGTAVSSGNFSPGFPREVIVAYGYSSGAMTAAGAGFTARILSASSGALFEDQVISSPATTSATMTSGAAGDAWVIPTATFIGRDQRVPSYAGDLSVAVRRAGFY
jgi:hypothetical protein